MLLSDLLKLKPPKQGFPCNKLECCLMRAAKDFEARNEFYNLLLSEELYTITNGTDFGLEDEEQDCAMNILKLKGNKLPIFTSKERIFDGGILRKNISYTHLNGRNLFRCTAGASFILNPFSDYGKELTPEEIHNMLTGDIFKNLEPQEEVVALQTEAEILLYEPKNIPLPMQKQLQEVLATLPEIKAAYFGGIQMEGEDAPHLILGLDTDTCIAKASKIAGPIVMAHLNNEVLDIIDINQNEGIRDYLLACTKPIYVQKQSH